MCGLDIGLIYLHVCVYIVVVVDRVDIYCINLICTLYYIHLATVAVLHVGCLKAPARLYVTYLKI